MFRYSAHCVQFQDGLIASQDIEQPAHSNFSTSSVIMLDCMIAACCQLDAFTQSTLQFH